MKLHCLMKTSNSLAAVALFFLTLLSLAAQAQQVGEVKGIVKDEKGNPISKASVIATKDKSNFSAGAQTDSLGIFNFSNLPAGNSYSFTISSIGYQPQTLAGYQVKADGVISILIKLKDSSTSLADVVVIGYGTQKKSELTSAISSVTKENLNSGTVGTVSEALQGKAAGVEVINNSNSPGGDISVRVRGISSLNNSIQPLYVVDGVPMSGNISFLNAKDIASIDVLKDAASAAIYGSRGANGVVLITTIKGTNKDNFSVTADESVAFQSAVNLIKMMGTAEYIRMIETFNKNNGTALVVPSSINGPGTDWMKSITRNSAPLQNYNITLSGGSKKVTYSSSLNYFNQKGIVITSGYERFNYRLNVQANISDKVKTGTSLIFTSSKRQFVPAEGDLFNSIFTNALTMDPFTPVYKSPAELANSTISPNQNMYSLYHAGIYTPNSLNPVGMTARNFQQEGNTNIFGNGFVSWEIAKNLIFKTNFGLEYNQYNYSNFNPTFYENTGAHGNLEINQLTKNENSLTHIISDNTLQYTNKLGDHSISILAGESYEHSTLNGINASVQGLPGDASNYRYLTYGTLNPAVSGTVDEYALQSFFARASYNYKSKYFVTLTDRLDGSSKFASGNQWGSFPSISGAWNISNESFFNQKTINFLKLRAGWGQIGNQNIPSNAYGTFLRNNANYNFGGALTTAGYAIQHAGNPNVSWETTTDFNIGLDFGVFKNKLTGSIDVYKRKVSNLLLAIDPPEFTGLYNSYAVTGIITNVGSLQNQGIDITLNYKNTIGKVQYNIGGIFSIVQNKVLDLGPLPYIQNGTLRNINGQAEQTAVGYPTGEFYGYKVLGIFQTAAEVAAYTRNGQVIQPGAVAGDFKFATNSAKGNATTLSTTDQQYLGSPLPKFTYGYNLGAKYKGIYLSAYFYGVYGNKIFNAQKALLANTNNTSNNLMAGLVDKAWHGAGTSNTIPALNANSNNNNFTNVSDFYLENGSYLRLKNLTFGYDFDKALCSKLRLSHCKFYVGVQNLFTITKYTGFDPAISNSSVTQAGVDFGGYPSTRSFILGCGIGL